MKYKIYYSEQPIPSQINFGRKMIPAGPEYEFEHYRPATEACIRLEQQGYEEFKAGGKKGYLKRYFVIPSEFTCNHCGQLCHWPVNWSKTDMFLEKVYTLSLERGICGRCAINTVKAEMAKEDVCPR